MNVFFVAGSILFLSLFISSCDAGKKTALPEVPAAVAVPEPASPVTGQAANVREQDHQSANDGAGIALTGTTEPYQHSVVTPRLSGAITKVHVREGDVVKKDAPLVTLDPLEFSLKVKQAEVAYNGALLQVESAKSEWQRLKALLASRTIPQAQFDLAVLRLKTAELGLAQADLALQVAKKAQRDAVVRAPFSGVITQKWVSEGEYAAVMPPTALLKIEQLDLLTLRLSVPATALAQIQPGMQVQFRFAATGQLVTAMVTRIVPSLDPKTRSFTVLAELPNRDQKFHAGMFGLGRFVAKGKGQP